MSNDLDGLLGSIAENPEDEGLRLVLADLLEERTGKGYDQLRKKGFWLATFDSDLVLWGWFNISGHLSYIEVGRFRFGCTLGVRVLFKTTPTDRFPETYSLFSFPDCSCKKCIYGPVRDFQGGLGQVGLDLPENVGSPQRW